MKTVGCFVAGFESVSNPLALQRWADQVCAVSVLSKSLSAGIVTLLDDNRVFRWLGAVLERHPDIHNAVSCVTHMAENSAVFGSVSGEEVAMLKDLCIKVVPAIRDTAVVSAFGVVLSSWPWHAKLGLGTGALSFAVEVLLDAVTRTPRGWTSLFLTCLDICAHFWWKDCPVSESRRIVPGLIKMWSHPGCVETKGFCLEVCCKLAPFSRDTSLYETCINRLLCPTLWAQADNLEVVQTYFRYLTWLASWEGFDACVLPHLNGLVRVFKLHQADPVVVIRFVRMMELLACGNKETSLFFVVPDVAATLQAFADNAEVVAQCFCFLQNMCAPKPLKTMMMGIVSVAVEALLKHKSVVKVAGPAMSMFVNLADRKDVGYGLLEAMPVIVEVFRCHLTDEEVTTESISIFEDMAHRGQAYIPFLESVVPDVMRVLEGKPKNPTLRKYADRFLLKWAQLNSLGVGVPCCAVPN
jgi:hypothetical protein